MSGGTERKWQKQEKTESDAQRGERLVKQRECHETDAHVNKRE